MTTTERQKAILGTLALNPSAYVDIAELVQPYMFAEGILRKVAEVIWHKQRNREVYDVATLEHVCAGSELSLIVDAATSRAVIADYATQVRDSYFSNQDRRFRQEFQQDIENGSNYFTARSQYQAKVEAMLAGMAHKSTKAEKIKAADEAALRAMSEPHGVSGIPTPYQAINEFAGGHQLGDYTIVGARPGMGKTTYLCELALEAAQQSVPTVFFSMGDLTAEALYMKMACLMAGLPMKKVRTGQITKEQYRRYYNQLELLFDWPIEIVDPSECDTRVGAISDKLRTGVDSKGWKLAIIDYIQQLQSDSPKNNENAEITAISKQLQKCAKSYGISLLAASQLSRAVETRGGDRRPQLSDLRSSGSLEQDADNILFLYRPAYYDIKEDENGFDISYRTEVIYKKCRIAGDEVPATFYLKWERQRLKEELADDFGDNPKEAMPVLVTRKADVSNDEDIPF